jgi:hypothetical protein
VLQFSVVFILCRDFLNSNQLFYSRKKCSEISDPESSTMLGKVSIVPSLLMDKQDLENPGPSSVTEQTKVFKFSYIKNCWFKCVVTASCQKTKIQMRIIIADICHWRDCQTNWRKRPEVIFLAMLGTSRE